jgi:hypothetical protein
MVTTFAFHAAGRPSRPSAEIRNAATGLQSDFGMSVLIGGAGIAGLVTAKVRL